MLVILVDFIFASIKILSQTLRRSLPQNNNPDSFFLIFLVVLAIFAITVFIVTRVAFVALQFALFLESYVQIFFDALVLLVVIVLLIRLLAILDNTLPSATSSPSSTTSSPPSPPRPPRYPPSPPPPRPAPRPASRPLPYVPQSLTRHRYTQFARCAKPRSHLPSTSNFQPSSH